MGANRTRTLNVEHKLLTLKKKILTVSSDRTIPNASAALTL